MQQLQQPQLEVAVSFLSEVVAQIKLDPLWGLEVDEQLSVKTFFNKLTPSCHFLAPEGCFLPLAASMRSEVKKD